MRLSDTGVLGVSDLRNLNFVGSGMRRGPGELIFLAMLKHVLHNCKLNVRVCRLGCTLGSVVGLSPGVSVWILGGGNQGPKGPELAIRHLKPWNLGGFMGVFVVAKGVLVFANPLFHYLDNFVITCAPSLR